MTGATQRTVAASVRVNAIFGRSLRDETFTLATLKRVYTVRGRIDVSEFCCRADDQVLENAGQCVGKFFQLVSGH